MKLSGFEEQIFLSTDFITAKRELNDKLTSELELLFKSIHFLFNTIDESSPIETYLEKHYKVSRGENYNGLPYFILDYPRFFTLNETFAIRSMILWGEFYSFTLQVSGDMKEKFSDVIIDNKDQLAAYYICVNDQPWEYHYENNNYLKIKYLSKSETLKILDDRSFLKLSIPYSINEYESLVKNGVSFYKKIISLI